MVVKFTCCLLQVEGGWVSSSCKSKLASLWQSLKIKAHILNQQWLVHDSERLWLLVELMVQKN